MACLHAYSLCLFLIINVELIGHASPKTRRGGNSSSKDKTVKDSPLYSQLAADGQIKTNVLDDYGELSKNISSVKPLSTIDYTPADNYKTRILFQSLLKPDESNSVPTEKTAHPQPITTGGNTTPPGMIINNTLNSRHTHVLPTNQYESTKHNSRKKEEISVTNHKKFTKPHSPIGPRASFVFADHKESFRCGKCLCSYGYYDFVTANCTHIGLDCFPQHLPAKTRHLNTSHNQITALYLLSIVQLKTLTVLAIRSNKIKQIIVDTSEISHLQQLDLGLNQIEKVEDQLFSLLPHLRSLSLQSNRLKHIGNQTFFYLTQLLFLDLSYNDIISVDSAAFNTLTNLRELSLCRNLYLGYNCKHFPPALFDMVKKLEILSIQGNSEGYTVYPTDALSRIKSLQTLNIDILATRFFLGRKMLKLKHLTSLAFGPDAVKIRIHTISADFFRYVPYIQTLSFNGCHFFRLNAYDRLPNLKSLSISNMPVYDLGAACRDLEGLQNSSLRTLRLIRLLQTQPCISLKGIHSKYMRYLPLVELDLSDNDITLVQNDFILGIPKTLKKLVLAYNRLTLRTGLWSRIGSLENLTELDVSSQSVEKGHLTRETMLLQTTDHLSGDATELKSHDEYNVSLGRNAVTSRTKENEIKLYKPEQTRPRYDYLFDTNAFNVNCEGEIMKNDCQRLMDNVININLKYVKADYFNFFGDVVLSRYISQNSLQHLLLSNSLLTHWGDGMVPSHVKYLDLSENYCQHLSLFFFQRNNSLTHISLSSNMLGAEFSTQHGGHYFRFLKYTRYLDLSLNIIFALPYSFLEGLLTLETLRMTDNRLQILNISFAETPMLRMLDVRRNSISWISKQTRKDLDHLTLSHPVNLALVHNPIPCTCGGIEIIKWLATTNVYLVDKDLLQCFDEHDKVRLMGDIALLHKTLQRQCTDKVSILMSCVISVSFFVAIVVGYYIGKRYRWWFYVKYKKNVWFAKWFGFTPKSTTLPATEYRYDAYICYSEDDRHLAIECANNLDRHKLFCPDRDILPGTNEVDSMTSGIVNSHKFLILLTENFKEDLRTQFQHNGMLEYAINMALFEEREKKRKFLHVVQFTNTDEIEMPMYIAYVLQDHDRRTTFPTDDPNASLEAIQCVWHSISDCIAQHEIRINDELEVPLVSNHSAEDNA